MHSEEGKALEPERVDDGFQVNEECVECNLACPPIGESRTAALLLRQMAFAMRISRALYAAAELNIADFLAEGPMTSGQLAEAAGADAQSLRRLLRALVA